MMSKTDRDLKWELEESAFDNAFPIVTDIADVVDDTYDFLPQYYDCRKGHARCNRH